MLGGRSSFQFASEGSSLPAVCSSSSLFGSAVALYLSWKLQRARKKGGRGRGEAPGGVDGRLETGAVGPPVQFAEEFDAHLFWGLCVGRDFVWGAGVLVLVFVCLGGVYVCGLGRRCRQVGGLGSRNYTHTTHTPARQRRHTKQHQTLNIH